MKICSGLDISLPGLFPKDEKGFLNSTESLFLVLKSFIYASINDVCRRQLRFYDPIHCQNDYQGSEAVVDGVKEDAGPDRVGVPAEEG